jgi:hypothetical protein
VQIVSVIGFGSRCGTFHRGEFSCSRMWRIMQNLIVPKEMDVATQCAWKTAFAPRERICHNLPIRGERSGMHSHETLVGVRGSRVVVSLFFEGKPRRAGWIRISWRNIEMTHRIMPSQGKLMLSFRPIKFKQFKLSSSLRSDYSNMFPHLRL